MHHEEMVKALRKRICLHLGADPLVFHEGALAEEFGCSRTPVREALLRLSTERLVETRAGVGTIASALDPKRRDGDFRAFIELLRAAKVICAGLRLDRDRQVEILTCLSIVEMSADETLDCAGYVDVVAPFVHAISQMIPDPIVQDAVKATQWRVIRWRVVSLAETGEATSSQMGSNARHIAAAVRTGDAAAALQSVLEISELVSAPRVAPA